MMFYPYLNHMCLHKLHDAIIDTICTFWCYFCENQKVNKLSPKKFRLFNVEGSVSVREGSVRETQSMSSFPS